MARTKSTSTTKTLEEAVTPIKNIEVTETVTTPKAESIKKYIIANSPIHMHSSPDLLQSSIVRQIKVNMAYEIKDEVSNVYGTFYKLDNNLYIPNYGDYTIF